MRDVVVSVFGITRLTKNRASSDVGDVAENFHVDDTVLRCDEVGLLPCTPNEGVAMIHGPLPNRNHRWCLMKHIWFDDLSKFFELEGGHHVARGFPVSSLKLHR